MSVHNDIEKLHEEQNDIILKAQALLPEDIQTEEDHQIAVLEGRIPEDYDRQVLYLSSQIDEIDNKIGQKRTDLLIELCLNNKNKFSKFCLESPEYGYSLAREAVKHLFAKMGDFADYWDAAAPVESFAARVGVLPFKTHFKLHDFESTTLLRENIANQRIKEAFAFSEEIVQDKDWDNICKFIATIVRPASEIKEFSFSQKAFVKSQKLKGMNYSERLDYYMEQLDKQVEDQSKIFENLPLNIAIGIIKTYWQKKKH